MSYHNPATTKRALNRIGNNAESHVCVTKEVAKAITQHEIIQSDRVPMVSLANELVHEMIGKQSYPIAEQGVSVAEFVLLTDQEESTYNSALCYLQRQFEMGDRDAESIVVRVENENEAELKSREIIPYQE